MNSIENIYKSYMLRILTTENDSLHLTNAFMYYIISIDSFSEKNLIKKNLIFSKTANLFLKNLRILYFNFPRNFIPFLFFRQRGYCQRQPKADIRSYMVTDRALPDRPKQIPSKKTDVGLVTSSSSGMQST